VVSRNDHQDAIGLGQGVTEYNPSGQAAGEIRRLWAWIERRTQVNPETRTQQVMKHVKAA
jgi:chromosome partitioning protein